MYLLRIASFLVLLCCTVMANCQDSLVDSLEVDLANYTKTDSLFISMLNDLAYEYHRIDIDKSKYYADLAIEKSKSIYHRYGEARATSLASIFHSYQGNYREAISLGKQAVEIASEIDNDYLKCRVANSLGVDLSDHNLKDQALNVWKQAYTACELANDTIAVVYVGGNIGEMHLKSQNYEKAKEYYAEGMQLANDLGDCDLLSITHNNMGDMYADQGNLLEAERFLLKSIEIRNRCSAREYNLGRVYSKLAEVKLGLKKYNEAKSYIDQSNIYLEKIGFSEFMLRNVATHGEVLHKLNKSKEAIQVLEEGIKKSIEDENINYEAAFKDKLASIYSDKAQFQKAYNFKSESKILYDSLSVLSKQQDVLDLENKYQLVKKEADLKTLKDQNIADAQALKLRTYFIAAALLLAGLIGIIAFLSWLNYVKEARYNSQLENQVNKRTQELLLSNQLLEKSNEELERFAYISSHDLKEPLKNITSFTKLITNEASKESVGKIGEYADILANCTAQLNTLVSDILDYSKVKSDLKIQEVDLNSIFLQVKSDLHESINSKNGELKSEHLPVIKSDKSKMYQAFKSIIENGVKYNKSSKPTINISSIEKDNSWEFKFKDNGIGIDPAYHDHIFMMFKRLHNKNEYPGSGIGLSTLKTIVEKLGGHISLNSKLNQGSEFTISLPKLA